MNELPDSRVYVHRKCNVPTVVSGSDFRTLSSPYSRPAGTFCVHCRNHFPIGEFVWADTDETLTGANARLRRSAPGWATVILAPGGCLLTLFVCVAGGLVGGWQLASAAGWPRWLVMPLAGFAAMLLSVWMHQTIENFVKRRYFGVADWREVK